MEMRSTFQRDIALEGATLYKYQANLSETKTQILQKFVAFLVSCTRSKNVYAFSIWYDLSRCVRCLTPVWLLVDRTCSPQSMCLSLAYNDFKIFSKTKRFLAHVHIIQMPRQIPDYQRNARTSRGTEKQHNKNAWHISNRFVSFI